VYSTLTDRAHFLTISWIFPFSAPRRHLSWRAADQPRFPGRARLPAKRRISSTGRRPKAAVGPHQMDFPQGIRKWIFHRESEKNMTSALSARGRKIPAGMEVS
jgi:hypothetical protein